MGTAALLCRIALGVVLAWSAVGKVTPAGFRSAQAMFDRLGIPRAAVPLLIGVEAAVAALIVLPVTAQVGAIAAALLTAGLTAGVAVVLRRGIEVRCACFGSSAGALAPVHLVRNAVLLVAALVGGYSAPGASPVVAVPAGVALALIVIRFEDLDFLFRPPATHRHREESP